MGSKERSRSRSKSKDRRKRSRSKSKDRKRSHRSRSRDRKKNRHNRSRSRSRDRKSRPRDIDRQSRERKSGERHHRRSRSRSRDRIQRRSPPRFGSQGPGRFPRESPPPRREPSPAENLTPEERDSRTIFVMQLSQRVRSRDVEEFFSSVGKIRDVRLIVCNKTRRFKGIAYVEFKDSDSVALALGLNGQKLCGVPVIVQPSQAEKNRVGNYYMERNPTRLEKGPMRLYVGSLHFNINEEMLRW